MTDIEKHYLSSDKSLLRRLQVGDDDAATALYQRYADRLLALARRKTSIKYKRRFDAEDVVQSVFRSFFRRARVGLYDVPDGGELWNLLLVLSLNKIRRLALHHTAQKRDVRATVSGGAYTPIPHPDDTTALDMLKIVVEEIIAQVPVLQQDIIRDRMEGFEISEIAHRVNRSKRTVERVLQQFRQRMTKVIDDE